MVLCYRDLDGDRVPYYIYHFIIRGGLSPHKVRLNGLDLDVDYSENILFNEVNLVTTTCLRLNRHRSM